MEKKKALILVNPRSGRIVPRRTAFSFGSDFQNTIYEPFIRLTTGPQDATDVAARLAPKFDVVVCRGGDGTLSETINGVLQSGADVPIGYIPGGTTTDFAKSNDIPIDDMAAIRLILENDPVPQDVGLFGESRYFCYTACFGLFTKSSYATDQHIKNRFGYAAYLAAGVQELRQIRPIPLCVTVDGETIEGEFIFGSVTNAYAVGGGVMKFPRECVSFDDGLMELVLVRKPKNPAELLRVFSDVQKGIFDDQTIVVRSGKVFLFDFLGAEIPWSIDGEFGGETDEVAVQCIRHGIHIFKKNQTTEETQ